MRKFRFIGDPKERNGNLVKGEIYDGNYSDKDWKGKTVIYCADFIPEDWQEVFDQPKPLHKDTDLGYFAGVILSSMFNDNGFVDSENEMCKNAISYAEELIRQLDEKTKNHINQ